VGILDWLFGKKAPTETKSWQPVASVNRSSPVKPNGRFGGDRHKPPGKWVQTTTTLQVTGTQHRLSSLDAFINAVWRAGGREVYGVTLEPEPANPHDRNAIKVIGTVGQQAWHIGYLDAFTAKEITADLVDKKIAIAAELYGIWVGNNGYTEVKIIVLAPPGNSTKVRLSRQKGA
jgi:hypothetical protein